MCSKSTVLKQLYLCPLIGAGEYSLLFTEGRIEFLDILHAFPSLLPPLHRLIGTIHAYTEHAQWSNCMHLIYVLLLYSNFLISLISDLQCNSRYLYFWKLVFCACCSCWWFCSLLFYRDSPSAATSLLLSSKVLQVPLPALMIMGLPILTCMKMLYFIHFPHLWQQLSIFMHNSWAKQETEQGLYLIKGTQSSGWFVALEDVVCVLCLH